RLDAVGLHAFFGLLGLGEILRLFAADFGVAVFTFFAAILGEFGFAGLTLLFAVLLLIALVLVLAAVAVAFLFAGRVRIAGLGKIVEDGAGEAGESALVVHHVGKLRQILAGAFLDERPPRVYGALERSGGRLSRHMLAHHQAHDIGDGRLVTAGGAAEALGGEALFQLGREVLLHAFHGQRADGFHAGGFRRLEDGGAIGVAGAEAVVNFFVVIGFTESIGIAGATDKSHFMGR